MAQRADLLMGPFMRPRFLYATDRSPGRAVSSKLDLRAAHTHEGAQAHTRFTKSRTAAGRPYVRCGCGGGWSTLCDERGLRRIGRRRASRTGDEPCSKISGSLSVLILPR